MKLLTNRERRRHPEETEGWVGWDSHSLKPQRDQMKNRPREDKSWRSAWNTFTDQGNTWINGVCSFVSHPGYDCTAQKCRADKSKLPGHCSFVQLLKSKRGKYAMLGQSSSLSNTKTAGIFKGFLISLVSFVSWEKYKQPHSHQYCLCKLLSPSFPSHLESLFF